MFVFYYKDKIPFFAKGYESSNESAMPCHVGRSQDPRLTRVMGLGVLNAYCTDPKKPLNSPRPLKKLCDKVGRYGLIRETMREEKKEKRKTIDQQV